MFWDCFNFTFILFCFVVVDWLGGCEVRPTCAHKLLLPCEERKWSCSRRKWHRHKAKFERIDLKLWIEALRCLTQAFWLYYAFVCAYWVFCLMEEILYLDCLRFCEFLSLLSWWHLSSTLSWIVDLKTEILISFSKFFYCGYVDNVSNTFKSFSNTFTS